jgi:lipoprotein-releasing system permease protein
LSRVALEGTVLRLKILEYALSTLWRRRAKSVSILAVYTVTIAVLASILLFTHSLRIEASLLLEAAPDVVVQRLLAGRHDLIPTTYGDRLRTLPGVGEVKPRYWGYYYDALSGSNYTVIGVENPGARLELLEGSMPSGTGECAIGAGVAAARAVGVGDDLILINSRGIGSVHVVVGVFSTPAAVLTNDLVVLRNQDLVELFGFPAGEATDLSLEVFNPNEVNTVAAKVKQLFPDTRPITRHELIRTYDAVFHWRSGMVLTIFVSALIAFCILAWDKATGISAEERREIGILKAIGWNTSNVIELKFWEGAALSVTAFLLGLLLAYIHVFMLGASILAPVLKGWSVMFPAFRVMPYLDLYQVFVMAFLTVVPYVASTVIPSWKTAITDPEEVMRT